MSGRLEITRSGPIILAAVRRGTRVTDLLADRADDRGWIGSIHLARVVSWDPGGRRAWVDIGAPADAMLPVRSGAAPKPTEPLIVQVTGEPRDGKPVLVTRDIALPGRYLVHLPYGGRVSVSRTMSAEDRALWQGRLDGGWVVRGAAADVEVDRVMAEANLLSALWRGLVERAFAARPPTVLRASLHPGERLLLDHPDITEIAAEDEADARELRQWLDRAGGVPVPLRVEPVDLADEWPLFLEPTVPLRCGGNIIVETMRTLTAIDVNAGAANDLTVVNREAAREVAHQLRIRNIGGLVVVDFINLPGAADRRSVLDALRTALGDDPATVRLGTAFTALGLVEMARTRRGRSLLDVVAGAQGLPPA